MNFFKNKMSYFFLLSVFSPFFTPLCAMKRVMTIKSDGLESLCEDVPSRPDSPGPNRVVSLERNFGEESPRPIGEDSCCDDSGNLEEDVVAD